MPVRKPHIAIALMEGQALRRYKLHVRLIPMVDAIPWFASLKDNATASATIHAWATIIKASVALVARGRVVAGITPNGLDTWRIGRLDSADEAWLASAIASFPARAHALAGSTTGPIVLSSAEVAIRACMDAVADTVVRAGGTIDAVAHPAYAGTGHVAHGGMTEWLGGDLLGLGKGSHLGLRLTPPPEPDAPLVAVLQLRSEADPSMVTDAANLWTAPAEVRARLGAAPGDEIRDAVRRGAAVWSPLTRLVGDSRPERLHLTDEEASDLVGPAGTSLAGEGIEVLWPAVMSGAIVRCRAVLGSSSPERDRSRALDLDALLDFRWKVVIDDEPLTAAEIHQLAHAERPLIKLRGRWIVVDAELVGRLDVRPPAVRGRDALAAALGGKLLIGGEQVDAVVRGPLLDFAERLSDISRPTELPEPPGLEATLREYQRRGLAWLAAMCEIGAGGCLADDMGLGKTLQVIALHLHRRRGPMLVVCPTSLLGTWERELHRFAPELVVRRYHGDGRHLTGVDGLEVVLATYGMVRRDRTDLAELGWDVVVADEAQNVKNPFSRGAKELRGINARARIALTGTPVENRLTDLWSILDWTTPGLLGPLEDFRTTVALPIERDQDQAATESFARVIRPFLLRRRKIDPDIAPELPAKTEADMIVPLTHEQGTLYEGVVQDIFGQITALHGVARSGLVLKLLTALKQICNHPAQYLGETSPLADRSGKLTALEELLDVILSEGDSVLVFTQYVAMARLIERRLQECGIASQFLHGQVPVDKREAMVDRFQRGEVPVFLLSLRAGGVGLTLTRATHVVHFDRWWNPAVEDQATDRAYRIGQDRPVQVHRLVTEGTVEDRIATLLERKREIADAVIGTGESWLGDLSDTELASLVMLRAPDGET